MIINVNIEEGATQLFFFESRRLYFAQLISAACQLYDLRCGIMSGDEIVNYSPV